MAAGDEHPEVHPHPGHRRGRQDHPARHVLPDERQLQLRRLLQAGRDRAGLGSVHQAGSRRRLRAGRRAHLADGVPRRRRGVRHLAARHRHPRRTASCAAARRTTPGTWASPGRPAPAASCSTTAATTTARRAARRSTRTATSSSGTSSSWSTSAASPPGRTRATTRRSATCRRRTSTPAWAWSGWPPSCRASTTSTRSTRPSRSSTAPPSSPTPSTARSRGTPRASRTRTTCGCGWWPTTSARRLMLIGDGVTPGNDGRGYVLRRILRRAIRAMRLLGNEDPVLPELLPVARDCMAPSYPELGHRLRAHLHLRLRRGGRVPAHPAGRHRDLRHRGLRHQEPRRHGARRRAGVPAARHLRLPDRSDDRDGRRAGPGHRRGRLPPADGAAAGDVEGRREGQEDRPPRPVRVPQARDAGEVQFTGYTEVTREAVGHARSSARTGCCRPRTRATTSRSSSTSRRSTPRAAARSPTGARSPGSARVPAQRRGARRPAAAARPDRAPRHRRRRRTAHRRPGGGERRPASGGSRCPAATPPPTCCTAGCAARSATRRRRPAR